MLLIQGVSYAQTYFPPLSGENWERTTPEQLGWHQSEIDSLYQFLEKTNTHSFIVLVNGKIVIEKYFGKSNRNTPWYWASAGKSLMSVLVGIAEKRGLININNRVSDYLGQGWTSATLKQESAITIRNLLSMTSGLDDEPGYPCNNRSAEKHCLKYLTDTGSRWAYHTGASQQLSKVIEKVSKRSIENFTRNRLFTKTGMTGAWVGEVFYSKPLSMARFGLLCLNKGVWEKDTLIEPAYFNLMIHPSQPYNVSYGYLWWLNGQTDYMLPGTPRIFSGMLVPHAPADMYAAFGKNEQRIYIAPGLNMVVVRMGENAYRTVAAFSPFDDRLWQQISSLVTSKTGVE